MRFRHFCLYTALAAATALAPANAQEAEAAAQPQRPKVENPFAASDDKASLSRQADYAEAMQAVAERQRIFNEYPSRFTVTGGFTQGGLVFGQAEPGASVRLDGDDVMVGEGGEFVVGFGRDSALTSLLVVTFTDGAVERYAFELEDRDFPVQRIDGLDQSKVSGFTEEQLEKIAEDTAKKKAARKTTHNFADWLGGFEWPVVGRISGVFGAQRILNGEPRRPHSGLDIAAPTGTAIRAPAAGVVTLAEMDMYFEGGLVLLDHGHWVESAFVHLSRIDVEPGQRVEKGEIIGAVGATGRATGPHLHWSLKWMDRLVDPRLTLGDMPKTADAGTGE